MTDAPTPNSTLQDLALRDMARLKSALSQEATPAYAPALARLQDLAGRAKVVLRTQVLPALSATAHRLAREAARAGHGALVLGRLLMAKTGPVLLALVVGLATALRALKPAPRSAGPSRSVRRKWTRQLEALGDYEVQRLLDAPGGDPRPEARLPIADAGITHGARRYPTRAFVEGWLGTEIREDDSDLWRHRLNLLLGFIGVVGSVIGVGFLLA